MRVSAHSALIAPAIRALPLNRTQHVVRWDIAGLVVGHEDIGRFIGSKISTALTTSGPLGSLIATSRTAVPSCGCPIKYLVGVPLLAAGFADIESHLFGASAGLQEVGDPGPSGSSPSMMLGARPTVMGSCLRARYRCRTLSANALDEVPRYAARTATRWTTCRPAGLPCDYSPFAVRHCHRRGIREPTTSRKNQTTAVAAV